MASEFVRKDAHARALLGMFCFALALEATIRPAVGAGAGDPRTYIEMTAGIVKTGLPYIENGPLTLIDRFPGLQMPWDVVTDGRAWGIYGPVYPYLAAPFLWYGGLRLMSIFTALMLIPVALASFLLARLVTRDELLGAYAGILTVVSTPLLSKAFEPSPYLLGTALIAGATYAAIRSTRAVGRSRTLFGALAGLLGGLTWGSHMLLAPMAVALWPAVAFVDSPAGAPESRRSFAITRGGLMAALGFGAGLALCIGPLAWLNSVRFHSWSPLSYGPVPWPIVPHAPMTARDELLFALPCFAWLGVVGGAIWLGVTRPVLGPLPGLAQRIVAAALLAGALAVLAHEDELRERLIAMGNLGYAFVVDQAHTADPYLTRVSRFGALRGDRLNKSVLQATPILLMVLLLRPRDRRER
ncbi:MAG TPA: hypothetical protein VH044_07085, partial [Polyangiaceae bacterium]|nr:hypothetical protein [Polyangiaceae bacterium]